MKIVTYEELLNAYDSSYDLSESGLPSRNRNLKTKPFSVIFEGAHIELDSLNEWIETNLIRSDLDFLYYSKTDYDYGFAEYFGNSEENIIELTKIIPNIYTIFPDSFKPNVAVKTFGCGNWIEYSPEKIEGIIVQLNTD